MLVVLKNLKFQRYYNSQSAKELFLPPEHVSGRLDNHPVENLNEGDDAESKKESKDASQGGDELHGTHPHAPLKF